MARIVAAAGYTEHITAVAERIVEAKDQATVHALLTEGVRALGADNAVFVSFIRDNADLSACRFMLVCEPDWCRRYLDAGCFAHDPWLAYAAHHSEPISASSLPVLDTEGQRPDGHFKFPHLWPVKLPQAGRLNYESAATLSAMREAASLRR